MCFRFLCFNHCPIADTREESNLRGELLKHGAARFNETENADGLFWRILEAEIDSHVQKVEKNKKLYFSGNSALIRLASVLSGGEKHKKWFGSLAVFLFSVFILIMNAGLETWLGPKLLSAGLDDTFTQMVSAGVSIGIGLVLVLLTSRLQSKRSQLQLRRYGETWIRHSAALSEYDVALMRFVHQLEPYDSGSQEVRNKLFQAHILEIRERNQKQFEQNMKELDEYIV